MYGAATLIAGRRCCILKAGYSREQARYLAAGCINATPHQSEKKSMIIETSLSKDQFIRISLLRHFQRISFYFWAITSAILTAYALFGGPFILLLVGWMPFGFYIVSGVVSAYAASRNKDAPFLQRTRYVFTEQGVKISSVMGESQLEWQHFGGWSTMAGCYVLFLTSGAMLAFPQDTVPPHQVNKFETLLRQHIGR
jgi:hypothetical protein